MSEKITITLTPEVLNSKPLLDAEAFKDVEGPIGMQHEYDVGYSIFRHLSSISFDGFMKGGYTTSNEFKTSHDQSMESGKTHLMEVIAMLKGNLPLENVWEGTYKSPEIKKLHDFLVEPTPEKIQDTDNEFGHVNQIFDYLTRKEGRPPYKIYPHWHPEMGEALEHLNKTAIVTIETHGIVVMELNTPESEVYLKILPWSNYMNFMESTVGSTFPNIRLELALNKK